MLRLPPIPALLFLCLLDASVQAQDLALDKSGGGIPGGASFTVRGLPNELYVILFAFTEQQTVLPALGVTLGIPDHFAGPSLSIPGFCDFLSPTGTATATVPVPFDPGLAGLRLSLQSIAGLTQYRVSNLVRLTLQETGTFAPTLGQPVAPIAGGGIVQQPGGELLFVGGSGPVAQRYSSRIEEWSAAGASFGVGLLAQTTGLADGRVLFTGGLDLATGQPTSAAAVYDPVTQQTTTLNMALPRAGHGASLLPSGRVLITGGLQTFDLSDPLALFTGLTGTTELFDPVANAFVPGPTMLEPRALHTATTLTTGEVLVAGGLSLLPIINLPNVSATAYRYNPTTNSFGLLPALFTGGRMLHSAVALSNGKVLLVGGITLDLTAFLQSGQIQDIVIATRTDCQVYTPGALGSGSFATVNGMQEGRAACTVAPLPGGRALIAGGFRLTIDLSTSTFDFGVTASADVLTAAQNALQPTGPMGEPRIFGLAAPLNDGTVLIVGGASSEVYQY